MQVSRAPRTLVVMRHAKASQEGPTDFERLLTERGHADAAAAGAWLAGLGFQPDAALVSAAARTRQTWEEAARAAGWSVVPDLSRALYGAWPESALDLVRATDPEARGLLVVGHNPTMESLAHLLAEADGPGQPLADLVAGGFPTSACAVFEVDDEWSDLAFGGARLTAWGVGRA